MTWDFQKMGLIVQSGWWEFLLLWFCNVPFSHYFSPVNVNAIQVFSPDEQFVDSQGFVGWRPFRIGFRITEFLNDRRILFTLGYHNSAWLFIFSRHSSILERQEPFDVSFVQA